MCGIDVLMTSPDRALLIPCERFQYMHSYHTEAIVNSEGKIELSLPFTNGEFTNGEKVAVVVMPYSEMQEANEEEDWNRLAIQNFFKDDSEGDSAYDRL